MITITVVAVTSACKRNKVGNCGVVFAPADADDIAASVVAVVEGVAAHQAL